MNEDHRAPSFGGLGRRGIAIVAIVAAVVGITICVFGSIALWIAFQIRSADRAGPGSLLTALPRAAPSAVPAWTPTADPFIEEAEAVMEYQREATDWQEAKQLAQENADGAVQPGEWHKHCDTGEGCPQWLIQSVEDYATMIQTLNDAYEDIEAPPAFEAGFRWRLKAFEAESDAMALMIQWVNDYARADYGEAGLVVRFISFWGIVGPS